MSDPELVQVAMWKSKNGSIWENKIDAQNENLRLAFSEKYQLSPVTVGSCDYDEIIEVDSDYMFAWIIKHQEMIRKVVNYDWSEKSKFDWR